jgi:hypothetical protein
METILGFPNAAITSANVEGKTVAEEVAVA